MLPRGADAVVMIEHADVHGGNVVIRRAVSPGSGISFAGSDIAAGETVLRVGTVLTSRETGVLAAIGENRVAVCRQPRVAIISTGNEIIAPGEPMRPAHVYDSNSQILADAVRELGGLPHFCGIVRDDLDELRKVLHAALAESDVVLLSGGTSKGQGDLCYRVVAELTDPGIVAHGVALKPGKPLCLAATSGKPVVILPGFPTSAIFTFHEFVAPVIVRLAGRPPQSQETLTATLAVKTNSEIGRTEYLLVGLVETEQGLSAFPMGKGSGSVTTFSRADGFVTIPRHVEIIEAGEPVEVRLIGRGLALADLVVIGSHCLGLDYLLSELQRRGVTATVKLLTVGSSAGLAAAKRGECDLAGIHLLDPTTGEYNRPFLSEGLTLVEGYRRLQGIVFRRGDARFEGRSITDDRRHRAERPRLRHGQSQPRQRHANSDRSLAGEWRCEAGTKTERLLQSAHESQRRRRRRRARPRRLGPGHRIRRPQPRPRLHPFSGRTLRLRRAKGSSSPPRSPGLYRPPQRTGHQGETGWTRIPSDGGNLA